MPRSMPNYFVTLSTYLHVHMCEIQNSIEILLQYYYYYYYYYYSSIYDIQVDYASQVIFVPLTEHFLYCGQLWV